jgi:antitoxin ParD1/3/4
MNVSLTDELEALVEKKLASGLYKSASEVVREGLRLLDERDRKERLEALLLEGLEGGFPHDVTPEFWKELWAETEKRRKDK